MPLVTRRLQRPTGRLRIAGRKPRGAGEFALDQEYSLDQEDGMQTRRRVNPGNIAGVTEGKTTIERPRIVTGEGPVPAVSELRPGEFAVDRPLREQAPKLRAPTWAEIAPARDAAMGAIRAQTNRLEGQFGSVERGRKMQSDFAGPRNPQREREIGAAERMGRMRFVEGPVSTQREQNKELDLEGTKETVRGGIEQTRLGLERKPYVFERVRDYEDGKPVGERVVSMDPMTGLQVGGGNQFRGSDNSAQVEEDMAQLAGGGLGGGSDTRSGLFNLGANRAERVNKNLGLPKGYKPHQVTQLQLLRDVGAGKITDEQALQIAKLRGLPKMEEYFMSGPELVDMVKRGKMSKDRAIAIGKVMGMEM